MWERRKLGHPLIDIAVEIGFDLFIYIISKNFSGYSHICYLETEWITQAPCDWKWM